MANGQTDTDHRRRGEGLASPMRRGSTKNWVGPKEAANGKVPRGDTNGQVAMQSEKL